MLVKPVPGLVIRDPDLLDLLPETGREVPQTDYWMRRLRDKDVVLADVQPSAPADATKGSNHE